MEEEREKATGFHRWNRQRAGDAQRDVEKGNELENQNISNFLKLEILTGGTLGHTGNCAVVTVSLESTLLREA